MRTKITLQKAKDLLTLWHIVRIAYIEEIVFFETKKIPDQLGICAVISGLKSCSKIFAPIEVKTVKEDMFNQSLEFFSPEFRKEVLMGRTHGSSWFLFHDNKARLKFINKRIERLNAEILKLQNNG